MIIERIKEHKRKFYILLITIIIFLFYYKALNNYFFSDDFEWLSRAILSQANVFEVFKLHGRDFNPVFLIFLTSIIKLFGLSPLAIRFTLLIFYIITAVSLFYILEKRLEFSSFLSFSLTVLIFINVFSSESILNLSASVYFLSFLFFIISANFLLKKRQLLFVIFFSLAFFIKEVIILSLIPLFIVSNKKGKKICVGTGIILILFRIILQISQTEQYTSFISIKLFFIKFYFILLRSINISPYSINPIYGIFVLFSIFIMIILYMVKIGEKDKFSISIFSFWIVYTIFFAFLPKLSSRYILFPSIGFITIYFRIFNTFSKKYKIINYLISFFILFSMVYNYPKIQREIQDYKILGEFSRNFIIEEKREILKKIDKNLKTQKIVIPQKDKTKLVFTYAQIYERKNLPKLLPVRKKAVGGVIKLEDLVPIIFYPENIAKFRLEKFDNNKFIGELIFLK